MNMHFKPIAEIRDPKIKLTGRDHQCSGCWRVFVGLSAFDRHHRGFRCNEPSEIGLVLDHTGRWQRANSQERSAMLASLSVGVA